MKIATPFFVLLALLLLLACETPGSKNNASFRKIKLPETEKGFLDQFHHAAALMPDSLDDDRKKFLEDSLKNSIDQWLSNKTGLKANRWFGIVTNDTIGYSVDGHKNVLQVYLPISKTVDTASSQYDAIRSVTLTMPVDEDDLRIAKVRNQIPDGDTVVFSGYFTPISTTIDVLSHPGDFFASPSLDFTLTELYKKGFTEPPLRPEPDTAGFSKAPVRVTAKMTVKKASGGRFLDFKVTVKNISDKVIKRSTVRWLVTKKNGEPAKVGGATGIWLPGYFNQELAPGEAETEEWEYESPDGEKVQLVYPKSVTLHNGTKWTIGK